MPYPTTPVAGVNLANTSSTAEFAKGMTVSLSDGGEAMYVQALSEISAFAYALVYADHTAQMSTTTLAANSKRGGWAQTSIPSGYYGWVQISGVVKGNLAANCDDNVPLYTTATSGVLDDATVSGGLVAFATSTVTISNATAVTLLVGRGQGIATGATPG
jgi:hypothetical protein